jgi:hypothetical protein
MDRIQLHRLLQDQGHTFSPAETDEPLIDVCPSPDKYLTVALEIDGTLKPAYRERYFACVRNAEDEPVLVHAPAFALAEPFATAAERAPDNNYFVMGPVRWLLVRIRCFEHVWVWPRGGFWRIDQAPHWARWIQRYASNHARVSAALLHLSDLDDCQALWEAANLVGGPGYDFFLSDLHGREVYLMHHHDKLVISIPDALARQQLLQALAGLAGMLEDCSAYRLESDEEFG